MPTHHRSAEARLKHHRERQIAAWIPVDLLAQLDEKLARTWIAHPERPRPSRQAFVIAAIRRFVETPTAES